MNGGNYCPFDSEEEIAECFYQEFQDWCWSEYDTYFPYPTDEMGVLLGDESEMNGYTDETILLDEPSNNSSEDEEYEEYDEDSLNQIFKNYKRKNE